MKPRTVLALVTLATVALLLTGMILFRTPRTIVFVRHAERADQSKDTLLSEQGQARAVRLATVLSELGVRKIYVTEYQRTQQTAQPLAQQLGLTPVRINASDSAALLRQLRKEGHQDPVLVVGHSDTLPELIKQLGVKEPAEIRPDEFYHLYIVVTHRLGRPTLLHLRY